MINDNQNIKLSTSLILIKIEIIKIGQYKKYIFSKYLHDEIKLF